MLSWTFRQWFLWRQLFQDTPILAESNWFTSVCCSCIVSLESSQHIDANETAWQGVLTFCVCCLSKAHALLPIPITFNDMMNLDRIECKNWKKKIERCFWSNMEKLSLLCIYGDLEFFFFKKMIFLFEHPGNFFRLFFWANRANRAQVKSHGQKCFHFFYDKINLLLEIFYYYFFKFSS